MARYIDADALIKKIYPLGVGDGKYVLNAKAVKLAIDNASTADVVPKSEVEATVEKLMSATDKVICEAKAEVARQIFEDIAQISCRISESDGNGNMRILCYQLSSEKLAELKKKYTEGAE